MERFNILKSTIYSSPTTAIITQLYLNQRKWIHCQILIQKALVGNMKYSDSSMHRFYHFVITVIRPHLDKKKWNRTKKLLSNKILKYQILSSINDLKQRPAFKIHLKFFCRTLNSDYAFFIIQQTICVHLWGMRPC